MTKRDFLRGVRAGVPIGLGYFPVSFSFGILAVSLGFYPWQAILISMITVTSAGQLSGIHTMLLPGAYLEMLLSQLTINVRYSFMSVSLSQKTDEKFRGIFRWLLGFFVTDEIFAVASMEKTVRRSFFFGLCVMPFFGWTLGTTAGALLGNVLPEIVMNALCIAIYAMFVAIVVPQTKVEKPLLLVVLVSVLLSTAFYYLPYLSEVSAGLSVSICAIVSAALGAFFFPKKNEDPDEKTIDSRPPDAEVLFVFNGTRKKPVSDGYRPHHLVTDAYLTTGVHHYDGVPSVAPDGTARGTITFLSPSAYPHSLWSGKRIEMREGKRTVGYATVTKVLNPLLLAEEKEDEKA